MSTDRMICRQMPLFASLPEADWEAIAARFPSPRDIPRGALLTPDVPSLVLLLSGRATVRTPHRGRAAVMRALGPGDLCGVAGLFGGDTPVSEVRAVTSCRVICLPRELVTDCLRQSFAFTESYIRFLTDRIRFLNRRIANYTENSAEERLLYYIRERASADGEFFLSEPMAELAQAVHIGRSSLYRAFAHLTAQGVLEETAPKRWRIKEELL